MQVRAWNDTHKEVKDLISFINASVELPFDKSLILLIVTR